MRNAHVPILMLWECDPAAGACEFSTFFQTTPQDLIIDGLYKALAVPWHSVPFRVVCVVQAGMAALAADAAGAQARAEAKKRPKRRQNAQIVVQDIFAAAEASLRIQSPEGVRADSLKKVRAMVDKSAWRPKRCASPGDTAASLPTVLSATSPRQTTPCLPLTPGMSATSPTAGRGAGGRRPSIDEQLRGDIVPEPPITKPWSPSAPATSETKPPTLMPMKPNAPAMPIAAPRRFKAQARRTQGSEAPAGPRFKVPATIKTQQSDAQQSEAVSLAAALASPSHVSVQVESTATNGDREGTRASATAAAVRERAAVPSSETSDVAVVVESVAGPAARRRPGVQGEGRDTQHVALVTRI